MGFFDLFGSRSTEPSTNDEVAVGGSGIEWMNVGNNKGLETVPSGQACIKLIKDSVSSTPLVVNSIVKGKKVECKHDAYNRILLIPNAIDTIGTLLEKVMSDYLTGRGEAFIAITRDDMSNPIGLTYIPQTSVVVQMDNTVIPKNVSYVVSGGGTTEKYSSSDMMHLVYRRGKNGVTPISIASAFSQMEDTATAAEASANKDLKSGGTLTSIISVNGRANASRVKRIGDSVRNVISNGGGTLVVEADSIGVNSLSNSAKERQLVENRQYNAVDIARFFLIPAALVDAVSLNSVDIEGLRIQLLAQAISPILKKLEGELNRRLVRPSHVGKVVFTFDTSAFVQADFKTKTEAYSKMVMSGMITPNDAGSMLGVDPDSSDAADKRYMVGGVSSLESLEAQEVMELNTEPEKNKETKDTIE